MAGNEKPVSGAAGQPQRLMTVPDGIALVIGMVVGVGIFKAPSIVAGAAGDTLSFILFWIAGGIASICGALVYAELSGRFPEAGGEYRFLARGISPGAAFVFAWARITVIQTGAIASVGFVLGEYAQQVLPLGKAGASVYAALAVIALTALNLAGTPQSKTLQKIMSGLLIAALVAVAVVAMFAPAPGAAAPAPPAAGIGLAMIFVLYAYGGWNEAAYLGGEVRDEQRSMVRILVGGIVVITAIYVLVNIGYVSALGLDGLRASKAIAADAMRAAVGAAAAIVVALIVCVAAASTMNAAILTGARTSYAFGRDFPMFGVLGRWREAGSTPQNALLLQGIISLALVLAGSFTQDGFSAMVAYTAPVFWTFFLLCGVALFVLRARHGAPTGFRAPFFPLVPIVFCAAAGFMLYSSVDWVGFSAYGPKFGNAVLAGIVVMALGIPLYFIARKR